MQSLFIKFPVQFGIIFGYEVKGVNYNWKLELLREIVVNQQFFLVFLHPKPSLLPDFFNLFQQIAFF